MADSGHFSKKKVSELEWFLPQRGIQHSNKRKQELVELCCNAKLLNIAAAERDEALETILQGKLKTPDEGDLLKPRDLTNCTNNFQKLPNSLHAASYVDGHEKSFPFTPLRGKNFNLSNLVSNRRTSILWLASY